MFCGLRGVEGLQLRTPQRVSGFPVPVLEMPRFVKFQGHSELPETSCHGTKKPIGDRSQQFQIDVSQVKELLDFRHLQNLQGMLEMSDVDLAVFL